MAFPFTPIIKGFNHPHPVVAIAASDLILGNYENPTSFDWAGGA
jgi:hypothetical protein